MDFLFPPVDIRRNPTPPPHINFNLSIKWSIEMTEKRQQYFDKLTFIIISPPKCIPKKADETGVISAEEERGSP